MPLPPLLKLSSQEEYRAHFEATFCHTIVSIVTFDNIKVRFRKNQFDHCMFESTARNGVKDQFSQDRATRMDWIKATLQNPAAELYQGWDKEKKRYDGSRRVAVVYEDFVVIIRMTSDTEAAFVTAYLATSSISKIKKGPKWK